ncbi:MAG: response regulator [Desulfovibrionaceae bacterium]|nr:response regulator [Desulfovibrionaceae bacterium]
MPNILIIDDDEELFRLMEDYLKDEGFSCAYAPEPEDGLRKIAENDFDAVVLDVMLPGVNGFEVLRSIRNSDARAALPVLMLTARLRAILRRAVQYVTLCYIHSALYYHSSDIFFGKRRFLCAINQS